MKPTATYYDLLEVPAYADLVEISTAYLKISRDMEAGNSPLGETEAAFRLKLIKHAYEVPSNPSRRAEYDAGLTAHGISPGRGEPPLHIEVSLEPAKWSPIRRLLTIIAGLMIFGMVVQIITVFMAYKRTSAIMDGDPASPAAEKTYLQDFYQTYGIRAASKAEAESLLADMKRKAQAESEEARQQRLLEEQERAQRHFEEESRRLGAQVSADLARAEQEAQRVQEEETRRKEEAERNAKNQELARQQRDIERFRHRGVSSGE